MTGFSSLCSHHHPSIHLLRGNNNNKNNNNNASTSKRRNVVVITGQKIDPKWGDGRQWGKNKLGKKLEHRSRLILEYEVAREFVWTLGLYDEDDWRDWAKDRRRGCVFIPRDPWNAYRNRGWIDMDDWLGRPLPSREASASRESSRKSGGYGRKRSGGQRLILGRRRVEFQSDRVCIIETTVGSITTIG